MIYSGMFLVLFILLMTACSNGGEEANLTVDDVSQTNNVTEDNGDDAAENDSTDDNSTSDNGEEASENDTPMDRTEVASDDIAQQDAEQISKEDVDQNEDTDNQQSASVKDAYITKLNETKKKWDETEAEDSSTYALKKVADDRYEAWDQLLNEVYGVLKEQLTPEEFAELQEEQRKWIQYRDDTALEASHEFKGGTQEHLEYSIVSGNLTEERCYVLVEEYMK